MELSVTKPAEQAFNRAVYMTFKPFNIGKWFALGFVVFLATLGEGGFRFQSWSGRFPTPAPFAAPAGPVRPTGPLASTPTAPDLNALASKLKAFCTSHLPLIISLGSAGILLGIVLVWLRARGRFMLIENIAHNTALIAEPWKRYRTLGNSLFRFKLLLIFSAMLPLAATVCVALRIAWPDIQASQFGARALSALLGGTLALLLITIVWGIIDWCTNNFVAPIMYLRNAGVLAGWREFRAKIVSGHLGTLTLVLLFDILLRIGGAIVQSLAGCLTCCIGFLPYLNCVVTLPVYIFLTAYPLYFLEQFGPEYVIIEDTTTGQGFEVLPVTPIAPPPLPTTPPTPPPTPPV